MNPDPNPKPNPNRNNPINLLDTIILLDTMLGSRVLKAWKCFFRNPVRINSSF